MSSRSDFSPFVFARESRGTKIIETVIVFSASRTADDVLLSLAMPTSRGERAGQTTAHFGPCDIWKFGGDRWYMHLFHRWILI